MNPVVVELTAVFSGVVLVVVNFLGAAVARYFGTMIFLDTVGTAIAGLQFGPLEGALVGLASNVAIGKLLFPGYWPFFYVNVSCGLVWGFIGNHFVPTDSEVQISIFVLRTGVVVALMSTLLSFPLRIRSKFATDHTLDKVGRDIEKLYPNRREQWIRISAAEFLLSHLLDRMIATLVGVLVVLEVLVIVNKATDIADQMPMYRELVELLACYYYLALGYAIKTMRVRLVDPASADGELIVLLGPLGLFSVLLAVPFLSRIVVSFL